MLIQVWCYTVLRNERDLTIHLTHPYPLQEHALHFPRWMIWSFWKWGSLIDYCVTLDSKSYINQETETAFDKITVHMFKTFAVTHTCMQTLSPLLIPQLQCMLPALATQLRWCGPVSYLVWTPLPQVVSEGSLSSVFCDYAVDTLFQSVLGCLLAKL